MKSPVNLFVILRILIGLIFVISGIEKLLSPYQNFQYVIESYQLTSLTWSAIVARTLPWVEFVCGVFAVLGLSTEWTLRGILVMFGMFIFVVGQALVRGLPIDKCGCFGEFISVPLPVILIMDSLSAIIVTLLILNIKQTKSLSVDEYFETHS